MCVYCSLCIFHSSHICMQYLVSFLVLSGTPALLARTMSPSLRGGAKRTGVGYAALVLGVGIAVVGQMEGWVWQGVAVVCASQTHPPDSLVAKDCLPCLLFYRTTLKGHYLTGRSVASIFE